MSGADDALPADEPIVYRARATRWEDGWELLVEGVGATHVSSLDAAERRVREYIQTAMGVDTAGAQIAIENADPLTHDLTSSDKDERPGQ